MYSGCLYRARWATCLAEVMIHICHCWEVFLGLGTYMCIVSNAVMSIILLIVKGMPYREGCQVVIHVCYCWAVFLGEWTYVHCFQCSHEYNIIAC